MDRSARHGPQMAALDGADVLLDRTNFRMVGFIGCERVLFYFNGGDDIESPALEAECKAAGARENVDRDEWLPRWPILQGSPV